MKFIKPVYAHCDLPCGVYDPAQARIEAESCHMIMTKYADLHSEEDKWRAVFIKEKRADMVKNHLWVLWTDYFKPEHLEKFLICTIYFGEPQNRLAMSKSLSTRPKVKVVRPNR